MRQNFLNTLLHRAYKRDLNVVTHPSTIYFIEHLRIRDTMLAKVNLESYNFRLSIYPIIIINFIVDRCPEIVKMKWKNCWDHFSF